MTKENINIKDLPLHINLYYKIDGKENYAHIQTRDFQGRQDAKIGDFAENWYCRPRKATLCKEYKNLADYKRACILSFKSIKKTATDIYFGITQDIDGQEYIKAI